MSSRGWDDDGWFAEGVCALGDRWVLRVLHEARGGVARFNDFADRLGVSRNVLAARLVHLVGWGLLAKREYRRDGVRCRYEYTLTDRGVSALAVLDEIRDWAVAERPTFGGGDRRLPIIGLPREARDETTGL
ncbi:winged helix-turn-helix transcriptional regulator [Pseudonocardia lutea]|uniref:Winged helix-turn-helix transcriptional regulator n=1 Tax=Pseudonocardia lutea TaxID=2172015 RepID=A0ABW1IDK2_9PSEU